MKGKRYLGEDVSCSGYSLLFTLMGEKGGSIQERKGQIESRELYYNINTATAHGSFVPLYFFSVRREAGRPQMLPNPLGAAGTVPGNF